MNKTKSYAKPIYPLIALALVLSVGIAALPMAGTVEANTAPGEVWVDDGATADGTVSSYNGTTKQLVANTEAFAGYDADDAVEFISGAADRNVTTIAIKTNNTTVTLTDNVGAAVNGSFNPVNLHAPSSGDPFRYIQSGINMVAGSTVHVAAGEYQGFLIKGRSGISIIGEEGAVVTGSIPDVFVEIDGTYIEPAALIYESDDISIEGIDFEGPGSTGVTGASSDVLSLGGLGIGGEGLFDEIDTGIAIGICSVNSTANITDVAVYNMTSSILATRYTGPDTAILVPEYVGLGMVILDIGADYAVNISDSQIEDCLAGILTLSLAPDTINISNTEVEECLAGMVILSMADNTVNISGGKVDKCLAGMLIASYIPEETVNISDVPVQECLAGIIIANEHVHLNNCSITGLGESALQEEFSPLDGEIPSYGIIALYYAQVDMLNCDISKCQGEWEIPVSEGEEFTYSYGGFAQEIELPTGIPSVALITDMDTASVNMIGCTISENDLGILAIPVMEWLGEFGGELLEFFNGIAGDFFPIDDFVSNGDGAGLLANMNNIAGNEYCGLCNFANETINATNNWWGSVDGPEWFELDIVFSQQNIMPRLESISADNGDVVVGNITYEPWLGAPLSLPEAYHESLEAGEEQVVNASEEAGTTITVTTTEATNITVAAYESQPFPDEAFPDEALGKYIDIYVSNPDAVDWPIHVELSYTDAEVAAAGIAESTLGLYYYEPVNTFHRCSDTGVNTTHNFIWANVSEEEASYLAGTAFGAGGHSPPWVPTVNHWGIVAMITPFAGLLVWTVRRRRPAS